MSTSPSLGVYAGTSGAVATTAALATTYTGLVLTNPIQSPVNLVLLGCSVAPLVAQAAVRQIGLMGLYHTTAVTQTTPVTPVSTYVGGGANPALATAGNNSGGGYGLLAKAATLPAAPVLQFLLGSLGTGAITVAMLNNGFIPLLDNLGNPIVTVPPGGFVAFYTDTASTASSLSLSFIWKEVP